MKHTETLMLALAVATMTMSGWAVGQPVPAGHRTVPPIAMLPPPPLLRIADAQAQPVRLAAMKLDVRVVGRLARSTVELTFQNPDGRVLEGKLQFPLRDGQQVFEEVTRTRVDPALLEATQVTTSNCGCIRYRPMASARYPSPSPSACPWGAMARRLCACRTVRRLLAT